MKAFKHTNHSCQIDCTNHDQVVNSLELKSKDLYYFWRNYQWLYNKYYSQKQQPLKQPQTVVSNREYQEQISKLTAENRKLRVDNQSLKRQIQSLNANQSMSRIQEGFQKQINRLSEKCKEYQNIRQKQTIQITSLMKSLKEMEKEKENIEGKYKKQIKKKQEAIVDLQTTIDELRAKQLNTNFSSKNQGQQRMRREVHRMTQTISNLEQQCYEIVEEQMDLARQQLLKQFPDIINKFATSGNLSEIIVQQYSQN